MQDRESYGTRRVLKFYLKQVACYGLILGLCNQQENTETATLWRKSRSGNRHCVSRNSGSYT